MSVATEARVPDGQVGAGEWTTGNSSSSTSKKPGAKKPAAKPGAKKPPAKKPSSVKPVWPKKPGDKPVWPSDPKHPANAKKPAGKKPDAHQQHEAHVSHEHQQHEAHVAHQQHEQAEGKKPSAKKPQSDQALHAQADDDLQQAKELDAQAADLRSQIAAAQAKLSNLYRVANTGTSTNTSSGSSGTSTSGTSSSSSSGSSTSGTSSSSSSSSASNQQAITTTQQQISSLQGQLKTVTAQASQLRLQASQLIQQAGSSSSKKGEDVTAILEKAATMTGAGELTYVSFPIEKVESTADGDLHVYGKATDGSVDSDEQIVDPDFSAKAIQEWLATGGNVRVQHNPQRDPAGVGVMSEPGPDGSQWVKSLIIEPVAKRLVSKGALRAYSVGIAKPVIVRDNVARGGRITGGQIVEISLVDRPANKNCGIQLVKSGDHGEPEYTGKVFGSEDVVAKAAGMSVAEVHEAFNEIVKTVTIELPEDVQVAFTPSDLDKIIRHRSNATAEKRQMADGSVVDSGGRDVSDLDDGDFAGPNKTYPIKTRDDVSDAASLAHHAADPGAVRSRIRSIAQRKFGMGDGDLPPSLSGGSSKMTEFGVLQKDDGDGGDNDCKTCHGTGKILEGHRDCPDCNATGDADMGKADGMNNSGGDDDDQPDCPLCKGSGKIRDGHVTCPKCHGSGNMPPADKAAAQKAQEKAERLAVRQALIEGILPVAKGSGPAAGTSSSNDSDDDEEDDDDAQGPQHSGDGMDEGLNTSNKSIKKGKKSSGNDDDSDDDDDDDDDDSDKGSDDSGSDSDDDNSDNGDDSDDDGDGNGDDEPVGNKGMKGGKIKPGGPKPSKKKKPKEFPPVKSMLPEGTPKVDGPAVEPSGKPTGMGKNSEPDEVKTARWQRAIGAGSSYGALHDLTCPAYHPDVAAKSHPGYSLSDLIDVNEWQRTAMDKAATAPIAEAQLADQLWQSAVTLKEADPILLQDLLLEANKAFSDANPGPGQGLTPTHISPGSYKRPYLSAGHAAPSPGQSGPNTAPVPTGTPSASQYQRGYLTAGHASESPSNHSPGAPLQTISLNGQTTPIVTSMKAGSADMMTGAQGKPSGSSRRFYTNAQRDNTKQAMRVIHDHIADTFPDLCPMGHSAGAAPNSVPVAKAASPAKVKKTKTAAKVNKNNDTESLLQRLEELVLKGELTIEDARDEILKTQAPPVEKAATTGSGAVSADVMKALAETNQLMTQMAEQMAEQTAEIKRLKKMSKRISDLENGPDPHVTAYKGVAMSPPALALPQYQASAVPAGMPTMTEVAERTQVMMLRELEDQWRNTPDPAQREAAWTAICKMRGLA